MDAGRIERIEGWGSRPFSGYRGLQTLADEEFTGAANAGDAWLFVLNGRVVGVPEGAIEDFEGRDGTAYAAPDPALPLLFAMQERGGETRAQYYTNETPLSEVDQTLSEGSFTGYVELSENVLSGDYYVVYYGGRSMSVAFVGASAELITGEAAFERADDEVGIYDVTDVDVDVVEVPDPEPEPDASGVAAGAVDPATEADEAGPGGANSGGAEADGTPSGETDSADTDTVETSADTDREAGDDPVGDVDGVAADPAPGDSESPAGDDPFSEEAAWRQRDDVPDVDPGPADSPAGAADGDAGDDAAESGVAGAAGTDAPEAAEDGVTDDGGGSTGSREPAGEATEDQPDANQPGSVADADQPGPDQPGGEQSREEQERLAERVERLEAQLEAARESDRSDGEAPPADATSLSEAEALAETTLLVRFESRGEPTLEDALDGADADAVNENLRLDHHTQFEAATTAVDGTRFEAFLADAPEYRFVDWLVGDLLYEIRDAGRASALSRVVEAVVEADRVDLHEAVETPEGDRTFDVVVRDQMGTPLLVANLNRARDPVNGEMMDGLVEDAAAVAADADLRGAFYVTESYFAPAALERVADATGGGLLRRSKRPSFVRTGRKSGFHLCLTEHRQGSFFLTVPEL